MARADLQTIGPSTMTEPPPSVALAATIHRRLEELYPAMRRFAACTAEAAKVFAMSSVAARARLSRARRRLHAVLVDEQSRSTHPIDRTEGEQPHGR